MRSRTSGTITVGVLDLSKPIQSLQPGAGVLSARTLRRDGAVHAGHVWQHLDPRIGADPYPAGIAANRRMLERLIEQLVTEG